MTASFVHHAKGVFQKRSARGVFQKHSAKGVFQKRSAKGVLQIFQMLLLFRACGTF